MTTIMIEVRTPRTSRRKIILKNGRFFGFWLDSKLGNRQEYVRITLGVVSSHYLAISCPKKLAKIFDNKDHLAINRVKF